MIMKRLLLLLVLVLPAAVWAGPSKPILKMINTPVTAFDFFLYQLEESCKCDKWFGNPDSRTDPCLTLLEYNIQENVIVMNFYVHDPSTASLYMRGFINSNASQREQIMRSAVGKLAVVVGVTERANIGRRYGLIQVTPIRRGWFNQDFDEAAVKEEVADRTRLNLQTQYQGNLYQVQRKIDGQIVYEVSKAQENTAEDRP